MSQKKERNYEESGDQPKVGTDPMELPQEDGPKKQVAPDPDEVEKARRTPRDE